MPWFGVRSGDGLGGGAGGDIAVTALPSLSAGTKSPNPKARRVRVSEVSERPSRPLALTGGSLFWVNPQTGVGQIGHWGWELVPVSHHGDSAFNRIPVVH